MKKYRCKICNKIIEVEDINSLDKCPICGAPVSFLEKVTEEKPEVEKTTVSGPIPISSTNPSIERINEKCIKCGRCSFICKNVVGINYNLEKTKEEVCVNCGQCILNCPTGAIVPKYCYKKVLDYLHDTEKIVIAFTSPAVRVSLGDMFNLEYGENVEGKMVSALKELGFDYVFDTTFGADLTIMEEASELVERIKHREKLPQFTSCCPAWVKYLEIYHPKLLKHLSSCKSPIAMQGAVIKSYFCEMMNLNKEDVITVAIAPCTAKKAESKREEINDVDFVITTTEATLMIREESIDFNTLEEVEFDKMMSRGSGGGVIFGNSGGVMESAVRTAYHFITGKDTPKDFLKFTPVRGYENFKEATITIDDITLRLLVVFGLKNIEEVLKELENGNCKYDFIEVMNCPGGCVGGGGQPLNVISKQKEIIEKRIESLYNEEDSLSVNTSYTSQDIIDIYRSYLEHPLSEKAEELLHTTYQDKSSILGE